jgi:hypothetical protein
MKSVLVATVMLLAAGLGSIALVAEDKPKAKLTVKDVMKQALAGEQSLCKKVATGAGTKEDAQKLLELFSALAQNKPPKGEAASWKAKTEALVTAAKACVEAKDGALDQLGKAANCKECHSVHKPPAAS